MRRSSLICASALLISSAAFADDSANAQSAGTGQSKSGKPAGDVTMSGMSILGNDEAPKSLVLVPWKSSQLGDAQDISKMLDDSRQPVDKEVFMRELSYYEIRSGGK